MYTGLRLMWLLLLTRLLLTFLHYLMMELCRTGNTHLLNIVNFTQHDCNVHLGRKTMAVRRILFQGPYLSLSLYLPPPSPARRHPTDCNTRTHTLAH
jgi:hypothetical protein